MADNTILDPGTGGDEIATDDIAGVKYPRSKIVIGTDGVNDGDVSAANPMPVSGTVDLGATDNAVLDSIAASVGGTLIVNGSGVTQPVSAASSPLPTGAATAAKQPALGTAGTASSDVLSIQGIALMTPLQVSDGGGSITVDGTVAVSGSVTVDGSGVTQPISGTVTANLGATDNAVLDSIDFNIGEIAGSLSGTELQVDVVGALPAGTNAIGKLAANSGVDIGDVDVTSIAAGSNLIGDVGIQGRATGGLSIFRSIDLDETEEEVKATAGTVYSVVAFNTTAAPLFLKFYNATAAGTTVGTTTPVLTLLIPGNADSDGAGFAFSVPQGIAFGTAITAAVTTAIADADTGAPGANAALVQVFYK